MQEAAKNKMKGRLLLDVILVRQSATILKLFAHEDKVLLVKRNSTMIGDDTEFVYMEGGGLEILALDGIELYGCQCQHGFVRAVCVPTAPLGNKLSGERNAGDEEQDEGLHLNVIIGESATILKLFACEDKVLPVRNGRTLLVRTTVKVWVTI